MTPDVIVDCRTVSVTELVARANVETRWLQPVVVIRTILLETAVAPIVLALRACHVVAAVKALSHDAAVRTLFTVCLFPPLKELCVEVKTLVAWVGNFPAFEANADSTLAKPIISSSLFLHKATTSPVWTPFQFWVQVDVDVLFEPKILFVDVSLAEFTDVFARVRDHTPGAHARYFVDGTDLNLRPKVVRDAVLAELVAAF